MFSVGVKIVGGKWHRRWSDAATGLYLAARAQKECPRVSSVTCRIVQLSGRECQAKGHFRRHNPVNSSTMLSFWLRSMERGQSTAKCALIMSMTPPDIELPDDVNALKAMVFAMTESATRVDALVKQFAALEARNADADERIERLTQILKAFDRAALASARKKLASSAVDDEQHAFVFEEIETGIAAIKAQVTKGSEHRDSKRAPRLRNRAGRTARACRKAEDTDRRRRL